ncbi:MAG: cbb3-type cytochrome c oxidase subunit II [Nitrosomonadales bacterium]|nr:cbb3-type cytochrome c oxidase subunit II [Nitrosomonadales bacterium]
MNFREYKVGARLFSFALGSSMVITLLFPAMEMGAAVATDIALDKQLSAGRETGFNYDDPLMLGWGKPSKVLVSADPVSGQPIPATYAYVYPAGTPFPSGILHPRTLGSAGAGLSEKVGRVGEAQKKSGAVFLIKSDEQKHFYIENATATLGWAPDAVLKAALDENVAHVGAGKTQFVREGCWWCHTLLPEQTQDWQVFGAPPMLGDFNGESPTAFGSDRKAPDLLHVASRNSSKEWMMLHFFNPRLVQPHSIMPRYDYLWGEKDATGAKIDFNKWRAEYTEYSEGKRADAPEVPSFAKDSRIRDLVDFMLSLK